MANAVLIVTESGYCQFSRNDTATEPGVTFQYEYFFAGSGKVSSGNQTIMA
jgi:hypothetical protein